MVKQLLLCLLPHQQRHKVPDRSAVEVRPQTLHEDRHLLDRHPRKLDVQLELDRSSCMPFVNRSALQRDPRIRVIDLDRHRLLTSPSVGDDVPPTRRHGLLDRPPCEADLGHEQR